MDPPKYRTSCDACLNAKVKCSQAKPACTRCINHSNECVYSQYRKIGRPSKKSMLASSNSDVAQATADTGPSPSSTSRARITARKRSTTNKTEARSLFKGEEIQQSRPTFLDDPHDSLLESFEDLQEPISASHVGKSDATGFGMLDSPVILDDSGLFPKLDGSQLEPQLDYSYGSFPLWQPNNFTIASMSEASSISSGTSPGSDQFITQHSRQHSFADVSLLPPPQMSGHTLSTSPQGLDTTHDSRLGTLPSISESTETMLASATADSMAHSCRSVHCQQDMGHLASQCMSDCYATLTHQLRQLSALLSYHHCPPLDTILDLDEQVTRERDRMLACPSCILNPRSRHAFMLVVMVLEATVALFERYCEEHQSSFKARPCHSPSLTIADVDVDESTEGAFTKALLRMHFERQGSIVLRLTQDLAIGAKDASYKAGRGILVDVCKRLDRLQSLVSLATE